MRAFVGYGELGAQVDALLCAAHGEAESVYFDDPACEAGKRNARPFAAYEQSEFDASDYYVCIGYRHLPVKLQVVNKLRQLGRRTPAFVHAMAYVSDSARIGAASIIYPQALIDKDVVVGAGVLLNNAVVISHNSLIGDCCYVSPGVTICGYVSVGAGTFLGAGAVVSDGVSIGSGVTVGIGSVVTEDLPSGVSAIGNPMKILPGQLKI